MAGGEQARQLEISSGELVAAVSLQGAYLEDLRFRGSDLLFPRQVIDEGGQSKTRGGLHICSPYFGPGKQLGLDAQHGFARNELWTQQTDESRPGRLVMTLNADDERFGPYQGLRQKLTYTVDGGFGYNPGLSCELQVENPTTGRMAMIPGLHPYFPVSPNSSPSFRFLTSEYEGETFVRTLTRSEMPDAHLIEGRTREVSFVSGGRQVTITTRDFGRTVVWSGSPEEYVCVEPTRAGFLGSQAVIPMLEPGASKIYQALLTWKPGPEMQE